MQVERGWRDMNTTPICQGTFRGPAGPVQKTSERPATQRTILRALDLRDPPAFLGDRMCRRFHRCVPGGSAAA